MNAALGAVDAGGAGVKVGLVLEEIQVPPGELGGVVSFAANSANGAGKDTAARKIQMDIQTARRLIEGAPINLPRWPQPQGNLK